MSVKDRIVAALTQGLQPQALDVIDESHQHAGHMGSRAGGETHFRVRITADAFANRSRVDRHRAVNALLADELRPDGVHALAIEARAPGEAGR
ncbi:BolA family transcriptional regulator [Lichenibacterium minor]|uniref:BolA family transcriptional regulator n=1 Tax=Lichenibacterium minor TaxID=2316528 RepID=A0A4Q2U7N4_9HYPH|nr:BolA family protein [Lichenibacterium minor]RYC32709.1 BolA family transcriptional regulator [Lichenibacterium minor]